MLLVSLSPRSLNDAGRAADRLSPLQAMHEARASHTATLLPDGRVLIAGGFKKGPDGSSQLYFRSAELFDPSTRTFTETGRMGHSRCGHTATLLKNGKALIAGGFGDEGMLHDAELYDPRSGTFSELPPMHAPREGHTATLLNSGKVLPAGGAERSVTETAELFDPATNRFITTGSMRQPRLAHTAALLPDGRVFISGGASRLGTVLSSDELYDPTTGTFSDAPAMAVARYKHAAAVLSDGSVLLVGGSDNRDWRGMYSSAELYNSEKNTLTAVETMSSKRFKFPHAVVVLPTGIVLIGGGGPTVELYVPSSGSFVATGRFDEPHYYATATLLNDGAVLIAGGYNARPQSTDEAWLFR